MEPTPFTIRIPDATLADLRERIDRVRWPDEIPGAGWQYGTDLTYLRQLVEYWRTQYDWRVHEARLNTFQQFTVPLSEIELHFIHHPGIGPAPLPLLLLHGWPGSIWEFHKLIPLLTDPARFGPEEGAIGIHLNKVGFVLIPDRHLHPQSRVSRQIKAP